MKANKIVHPTWITDELQLRINVCDETLKDADRVSDPNYRNWIEGRRAAYQDMLNHIDSRISTTEEA